MHLSKNTTVFIITALFTFLVLFSTSASAASAKTSTKTLFNKGVQAFSKGDYDRAESFFKAAQKSGLHSDALYYNLGVCYFKLKLYSLAKKAFQRLAESPDMAALAHYNLGLIALRVKNISDAETHFQSAYRLSKDPSLKRLAEIQLTKLGVSLKRRAWLGYLSLGAGYDDNVFLDVKNGVVDNKTDDAFLELIAFGMGQLTGTRENGLQIKVSGYTLKYLDNDDNDFVNFHISPEFDRKFGVWQAELNGRINRLYLGGAVFERIVGAGIMASRPIVPKIKLDLRYQFNRISAEDSYDYLSGNQHQIGIGFRSTLMDTYSSLNYLLELNNRNDVTYPIRNGVYFAVYRDITARWAAKLTGGYRLSEYRNISRNDKRLQIGMKVSRKIPRKWKLYGKYAYTRNDSNDNQNKYVSNILSFGIDRFF